MALGALQRTHEFAVHDSGREWIEIAGDRRHSGFVEQRKALLDIAVQDEQARFCDTADGARRRVALRAHFDGTTRPSPSIE